MVFTRTHCGCVCCVCCVVFGCVVFAFWQSVLKQNVVVRGDLAKVKIHKYTIVEEGTTIQPCTLSPAK